jgi:ABC-type antimicrobial peptide transport system permease subunit
VLSYPVTQRTREIGLRMALGATRNDVMRMIAGHGLGLILAGLAAGGVAAFLVTRAMAKLLDGVASTDPLTYASVSLILPCGSDGSAPRRIVQTNSLDVEPLHAATYATISEANAV